MCVVWCALCRALIVHQLSDALLVSKEAKDCPAPVAGAPVFPACSRGFLGFGLRFGRGFEVPSLEFFTGGWVGMQKGQRRTVGGLGVGVRGGMRGGFFPPAFKLRGPLGPYNGANATLGGFGGKARYKSANH